MNPFETERAARLYAAGRPDYSETIVDIVRMLARIDEPLQYAVDVGCGTGISTAAIARLANRVEGVEPSTAMLQQARSRPNVSYRIGTAEDIPVPDSSCDLVAVGSALHWFDRDMFLKEADRIAKTEAAWSSSITGSPGQ